jgi:MFS transporter, ACS family, pantothenate transporter
VTDAPNCRKGYIAIIVTGAFILPLVLVIAFLERRGFENGTLGTKFDCEESREGESEDQEASIVALHLPDKV